MKNSHWRYETGIAVWSDLSSPLHVFFHPSFLGISLWMGTLDIALSTPRQLNVMLPFLKTPVLLCQF